MNALEQQSQASESFWGTVTGVPRDEPISDAQAESAEMRSGTGTALQQTSFGRATDPAAPQLPEQEQRPLSDWEMEELEDQTVRDPAYIPTFNEWDAWDQKRAARSSSVDGLLKGAGSIAQAIGSVGYSVLATPGNFAFRGFGPAYDTLVHSSAEGMRRAGVGMAEMITWAGDTAADIRMSTEREAALDNRLRKQMAEENAFTGNAQADAQIFAQAKEKARSEGFYELTEGQQSSDRREQYDRFVRGRALEQEFLGIGNFTMGNDPIATGRIFGPKFVGGQPSRIAAEATTKTDYGIDDSKVDEGIATGVMIAGDPTGWLPLGAGALNKVKAVRRLAVLADKPMGWTAGGLGRVARIAEDIEAKALGAGLTTDRLAKASGAVAIGAGAIGVSQNNDLAKGIAAAATILPAVRYSGKILRRAEGAAQAGQMVIKEMGVGGVGVMRADSASRLADNAAIPGRYRDAMRGFFSGPESSLKRASQNEALPLSARKTLARLDRAGATQAFRIADDAVSGALAGSVAGLPFAAIAPEDKQAEIFGSIAMMGALGGAVSGPLTRRAQMADADVARMLADIEAVGGDAVTFAQLPHDKLARLAAMQGVVSSKADFVPLRADEYAANKVLNAKNATTTKGLYIDAEDGNRPRIFINIDQLAAGDVGGHEIGHAILKSDILGGEIKNNMRNLVNVQYGQDGVVARGREYATKLLADEVEQGVTGDMPQVLSDAEMQQVDRGAKPEDIIRSRWQDKDMRERMINERIDEMNQREMAGGGMEWDWARDEIAAETFSGLSSGIDFRNIRQSGPMAAALGAFSGTLDMMGARFRGNGRLETPNRLFEENPLMDTPQMRKAVTDYTKAFDRYLAGMERDAAPKQRGTKVAPTGKASEAARSQHNRVYPNDKVVENDIFIVDANGNQIPKSQQQIDTQEKARAATLKSINKRDRLVPMHSNEWGARKVGNRTEVGGPNLPMQFDHFVQVPEWLRTKAREFEAGRKKGQSYRISYNAIGTGVSGSYKIKNLGNVEAITREMVPFGWQLSEKNHLLAKAIDLDAFRSAAIRAVDRGELPDFGNNVKQVEADLKAMLKNYEDGLPGETGIGVLKRNMLNGLLGTGTAVQKAANPLYAELNPKGSIRTFRFDRLNYADSYATGYFPHYHKINTNALPREVGVMSLDEWRQFDADRKSVWINNRAREAGYTNAENWRGADEAGFGAADAQYRSEFPMPAQGGAAALPGDTPAPSRIIDPSEPKDVYARSIEDIKSVIPPEQRFVGNKTPGRPVLAPDGRPYLQHDLSKPTGNLFIKQSDLDQAWREAVAETGPAAQRALDEMRARGFNMVPPNEAHWRAVGNLPLMDRFWYETSAEAMVISFPGMAQRGQSPKVMDTVAATSPLADPNYNAKLAISFLSEDLREVPAQTPAPVPKGVSDALLGTFGREEQRKIGSFGGTFRFLAGLSDDPPLTTNDRQVASSFGVPDKVFGEFPVMYEAVSRFYNKLRDTINAGQADKSMGAFESHQLQALSWVQHRAELELARSKNVSVQEAFDGDAYAVAFRRAADELRAEGIAVASDPATGLPIFDDAVLSDPRVVEILAPTTKEFVKDTFQTMEIVTKLTKTGDEFLRLYEESKAAGVKGNIKDAEAVINRGLTSLMTRKDYVDPDYIKLAMQVGPSTPYSIASNILGQMESRGSLRAEFGKKGTKATSVLTDLARVFDPRAEETTRIEFGFGTFQGDFGPNLRIPLSSVPEQYRPAYLAILGKPYAQAAQAASSFISAQPGQTPTSYSVFFKGRVDVDFLGDMAQKLSAAGHEANVSVRPNGVVVDVVPRFTDSGPVPIDPALLKVISDTAVGDTTTASVIDRDFSSIYLERTDYAREINKGKKGLLNDTAREIQTITGAGRQDSRAFAEGRATELSGNKAINRRAEKARDRYRQRVRQLESVETRIRDMAKEFERDMARASKVMQGKLERQRKAKGRRAEPAPAGLEDL
jgi:hypothetical protein